MAKKIKVWEVTAPFVHDGVRYEPGDEWAQPANWELDEPYMELLNVRVAKGKQPRIAFNYSYDTGLKEGKEKKPVIDFRRVMLPVKEK